MASRKETETAELEAVKPVLISVAELGDALPLSPANQPTPLGGGADLPAVTRAEQEQLDAVVTLLEKLQLREEAAMLKECADRIGNRDDKAGVDEPLEGGDTQARMTRPGTTMAEREARKKTVFGGLFMPRFENIAEKDANEREPEERRRTTTRVGALLGRQGSASEPRRMMTMGDDAADGKINLGLYSKDVQDVALASGCADDDGKVSDKMAVQLLTVQARRDAETIRVGGYSIIGLVITVAALTISVNILVQPVKYDDGSDVMRNPSTGNPAQCANSETWVDGQGRVIVRGGAAGGRRLRDLASTDANQAAADELAKVSLQMTRSRATQTTINLVGESVMQQFHDHLRANWRNQTRLATFDGKLGCEAVKAITQEAYTNTGWMSVAGQIGSGVAWPELKVIHVSNTIPNQHSLLLSARHELNSDDFPSKDINYSFDVQCGFGPIGSGPFDCSTLSADVKNCDMSLSPPQRGTEDATQASGRRRALEDGDTAFAQGYGAPARRLGKLETDE